MMRSLVLRNTDQWGDGSGKGSQHLREILIAHAGGPNMDEKALKEYHEEVEHQLYRWECQMPKTNVHNRGVSESTVKFEGDFVRGVLELTSNFLTLDVDTAVILSGVITKLCQCPDARLHSFLLDTAAEDPKGGKSLPNILIQVCKAVDNLMTNTAESTQLLESARSSIDQGKASNSLVQQFQTVVVWQELVKELVATIEMKNLVFPLLY